VSVPAKKGEYSMNGKEVRRIIMKRMIISPVVFTGMFVMVAIPDAKARDCSNASLQGGYGFSVSAIVLPAGTTRVVLGRLSFDGSGNFTNTLTINDNGTVTHATDVGSYTVDADCTAKIVTNGGTRTIEIVLVDAGKEFYQLRTDSSTIVFMFNAAKKQFPDDNQEQSRSQGRKN
jgi:hypothetical protein